MSFFKMHGAFLHGKFTNGEQLHMEVPREYVKFIPPYIPLVIFAGAHKPHHKKKPDHENHLHTTTSQIEIIISAAFQYYRLIFGYR